MGTQEELGGPVVAVWPTVRKRPARLRKICSQSPRKMDKAVGCSPEDVRMVQPGLLDDDFRPCYIQGIFHIAIEQGCKGLGAHLGQTPPEQNPFYKCSSMFWGTPPKS